MKYILKYSLIIGIGNFLWTLFEYALGYHSILVDNRYAIKIFSSLIAFAAILFAFLELKLKDKNLTYINYAYKGLNISFFASIIATLLHFVYIKFINPEFLVRINEVALKANEMIFDPNRYVIMPNDLSTLPGILILKFLLILFEGIIFSCLLPVFYLNFQKE